MAGRVDHNDGRGGAKKGTGKRGSVNNAGRLSAFKERSGNGDASWGDCDPKGLQAVICEITGMGGAITIGLSRDMGAHSLTLLLDGDRQTLWFNGDADLDDELLTIMGVLGTMG